MFEVYWGLQLLSTRRVQTVSLSAPTSESSTSTSVCPVRALRIYIAFCNMASFSCATVLVRGRAVSKQRLSHWIVDAITAAYTSQGLECPFHIRAHLTTAIASSLLCVNWPVIWTGISQWDFGGGWKGRSFHSGKKNISMMSHSRSKGTEVTIVHMQTEYLMVVTVHALLCLTFSMFLNIVI